MTGLLLLFLFLGFFAGRSSIKTEALNNHDPIKERGQISTFVPVIELTRLEQGVLSGKTSAQETRLFLNKKAIQIQPDGTFQTDTGGITIVKETESDQFTQGSGSMLYVGSKNSNIYHPVGSSAANRIAPQNKVFFTSKEDAESKGYKPGKEVK